MSQNSPYSDPPIALTPKQANIYVWGWQKKSRFRDAVCGRRFGKTFLGKAEIRRAVRLAAKWGVSVEDEIWYCAPTFKQAKRVFWRRLKQAIPASWRATKPNETECSITTKAGHVVRIVGLDAYDNLRGSGLFFALVDEWADCPYAAWEEVLRPMLSTCKFTIDGEQRVGGHALRIGTPKGFNHCYDSYLDGQGREPDHKSWLYTSVDGGNVPAEEIEAARRKMDPRTFRQEYLASFENYQGVIYYCFDRRKNCTDDTVKPGDALHIGMDFNVAHMAAVVFVIRDDMPRAVDEFMEVFDTPAMIEKIKAKYQQVGQQHAIAVYPDASGQNRKSSGASESDLTLLRAAKFTVVVDHSKTTGDIVREIRGTKALKYADGLLDTSRRQVDAVVRTALSHTGQITRTRFTQENEDILGDEMWVSTLDGKTSPECRARDHLMYTKVDHKPVGHSVPWRAGPGRLHWCCRSTSIALLKGQKALYGSRAAAGGPVDGSLTYNDWLKQQSAEVQDQVLGKAKGEKYRAGKYDASIFTNDKGRTLTLKEMADREARAFKQPSGEFTIYDPGYKRVAPDVSTPARAAAVKIEDAIRNEKNEFGAFVAPDGQVLLRRSGLPDQVTFFEDELATMKGAVFTHNHPGGLSFSPADVRNAAFSDLAEVRAVAPQYRHMMSAKGKWPAEADIDPAFNAELTKAQADVATMVKTNQLNVKYAPAEIHHLAWTRAAAKLGLTYTREAS